ncbi:glutathione peroxidase [Pseudoalteromonas sp. MMG007]|uniref:glutathione peroxidase n=1 Tax=Pseudoalteromonas sp. MMG007 TaxID=2822684 RepID=UPI001B38AE48|nr:glutathione peroxidase [Pseudoalteromonas sp. MMG007]MBQ4856877.1 glutathione peroxidase [Pseudoalteromonas sp. MMG007]
MLKKIILGLAALCINIPLHAHALTNESAEACQDFTNVDIRKLRSEQTINLCQFKNKPLLIVNTASNCGFTPQFRGLEALYKQYKDEGLVILGFPSDDFFQEENDEKLTAKVCFVNYGVTFPMFATSEVRGSNANAIFKHLNERTSSPNWNFYKYLVSADRKTITRFNSKTEPSSARLVNAIEKALSNN